MLGQEGQWVQWRGVGASCSCWSAMRFATCGLTATCCHQVDSVLHNFLDVNEHLTKTFLKTVDLRELCAHDRTSRFTEVMLSTPLKLFCVNTIDQAYRSTSGENQYSSLWTCCARCSHWKWGVCGVEAFRAFKSQAFFGFALLPKQHARTTHPSSAAPNRAANTMNSALYVFGASSRHSTSVAS